VLRFKYGSEGEVYPLIVDLCESIGANREYFMSSMYASRVFFCYENELLYWQYVWEDYDLVNFELLTVLIDADS